jgi:hypothetical protein
MALPTLKKEHLSRKALGTLALEGLVIFAGVTASFWMEQWREGREDLHTYTHLLEEIYYNAVVDEASTPISIAANNLALKYALELTVLDSGVPTDRALYPQLKHIFSGLFSGINSAGYVRLSNTSLSLPFDETMVTLDNSYQSLIGLQNGLNSLDEQLGQLRADYWRSAGMVDCSGAEANDGTVILMDRPYMAEIRTLLYPDGQCIAEAANESRARELLAEPGFRNAVRQVIDLRQDAAWLIGLQSTVLGAIRGAIEARLPDVELPIASLELISWPRVTVAETETHTHLKRTGPHTWEAGVELTDGFIKFKANDDWSINWGAPFPAIIDAPRFLWNSDRIRVDDVFPAGTAHFNGMNLPVRAGSYRVTFNSHTFEYRFDEVEPVP